MYSRYQTSPTFKVYAEFLNQRRWRVIFEKFLFSHSDSLKILSILFDIYQQCSLDTQHHLPLQVYAEFSSQKRWSVLFQKKKFDLNSLKLHSIFFDIYQKCSLNTQHHLPMKVYMQNIQIKVE